MDFGKGTGFLNHAIQAVKESLSLGIQGEITMLVLGSGMGLVGRDEGACIFPSFPNSPLESSE